MLGASVVGASVGATIGVLGVGATVGVMVVGLDGVSDGSLLGRSLGVAD